MSATTATSSWPAFIRGSIHREGHDDARASPDVDLVRGAQLGKCEQLDAVDVGDRPEVAKADRDEESHHEEQIHGHVRKE